MGKRSGKLADGVTAAVIIAALIATVIVFAIQVAQAAPGFTQAQYLMVDENGRIVPEGYTLGLDQLAEAAAEVAAASNRTIAVNEATDAARSVVSNLTEVLVGNNSFGYIDGFTVSFGGVANVSTNADCQIVKFEVNAWNDGGTTNINGVACTGHYIYFYFSEPMNTTPYIKWKRALDGTNDWEVVECQDIVHYPDGTVLDGQAFNNLYRATAYTDATLAQSFYLAYCEIAAADGDGSMFNVYGGLRINGETGITGDVLRLGAGSVTNVFTYKNGLLMAIGEAE